jgi:hypothetical protein
MIEWFQLAVAILSLIAMAVVLPLYNSMRRLRSNEIHALQGDIAALKQDLVRIEATLHERVDGIVHRLDTHIQWHLNQAMKGNPSTQEGP